MLFSVCYADILKNHSHSSESYCSVVIKYLALFSLLNLLFVSSIICHSMHCFSNILSITRGMVESCRDYICNHILGREIYRYP